MSEMDVETEMSRAEAAEFFRVFADKLEGHGSADVRDHESTADARDDEQPIVGDEDATAAERGETRSIETRSIETGRPETMTVIVGGESATVVLPERFALDVEVGSRSGLLESGVEQRVEFELVWTADELPEDDSIEVV